MSKVLLVSYTNNLCQTGFFRGGGFYSHNLSQMQERKQSSLSSVAVCSRQLRALEQPQQWAAGSESSSCGTAVVSTCPAICRGDTHSPPKTGISGFQLGMSKSQTAEHRRVLNFSLRNTKGTKHWSLRDSVSAVSCLLSSITRDYKTCPGG